MIGAEGERRRGSARRSVVVAVVTALAAVLLGGCRFAGVGEQAGPQPTTSPVALHRSSPPRAHHPKRPVNHCAKNRAPQRMIVSIRHQHLWLCSRHRTVFDTPVTTGRATPATRTPRGTFTVSARVTDTVLRPDTGGRYPVKYWIPFDAPDYGFHDAHWQHFRYGTDRYRTAGSHGCVHVPLPAMRHLYRWVHVGAAVTIR